MGPAQRPRRFSLGPTQRPAGLASFGLSIDPEVPTLVGGSGSETRRSRFFHDLVETGGSHSGWMGRCHGPAGLGWLTLSSEPDILRRFSRTLEQCFKNPTTEESVNKNRRFPDPFPVLESRGYDSLPGTDFL